MKFMQVVLPVCLFGAMAAMAETVTLVATAPVGGEGASQTLTIHTNQLATVRNVFVPPEADFVGEPVRIPFIEVTIDGKSFVYKGDVRPVVSGPATMKLSIANTNTFYQTPVSTFCAILIQDNQPQFSPSTAVVIPTDATGPVRIVLESSPDLLNWSDALPGTYGSSTTNRFFRVRAVRQ